MLSLSHFVNGAWAAGQPAHLRSNPSDTRETVAEFPEGDDAVVEAAVNAARSALARWSAHTVEARSDLLERVAGLLLERRESLGTLLSREEGKTRAESIAEVVRAARIFRYFAGEPLRQHGRTLDSVRPAIEVATYREPVGVVALITPWNYPLAIPAWKIAPALAFGNTVVMKPASYTTALAVEFARLIHEAGAPAGVFNLVLGSGRTGELLVRHAGVDAVSFTGSQNVGAQVAAIAVSRNARVQLEMGGKNPLIVLDDADFDRAVACALDGAFHASGQRCTASSRIIVTRGVYERFVTAFAQRAAVLRVGDALDPNTQIGPVVSESQLRSNLEYVGGAIAEGGRLVCGGQIVDGASPGHYMSPAVIADTHQPMRINREEVFGPVATILSVADYDEALVVANAGEFGLSAGICTTSLATAHHFLRSVRAGMATVNLPTAGVDYHVPFGGVRRSSYGAREQGYAAVEFFTQTKTTYIYVGR